MVSEGVAPARHNYGQNVPSNTLVVPTCPGYGICKWSCDMTNASDIWSSQCENSWAITKFFVEIINQISRSLAVRVCDLNAIDTLLDTYQDMVGGLENVKQRHMMLEKLHELLELRKRLEAIRSAYYHSIEDSITPHGKSTITESSADADNSDLVYEDEHPTV